MKISELYTIQRVKRKSRNPDGSLSMEEKTFKIPYNPNVELLYRRLLAKLIDVFSIIGIMIGLYKLNIITIHDSSILIPSFLILIIIFNAMLETLIGSSFAKMIFGLEVVDDNCQKLKLSFSIYRNSYLWFLIVISLGSGVARFIESYKRWQSKKKFYVIKKKDKVRILKMMSDKTS